jgi:DNA-binding transcriptional ArsR family regulator
MSLPAVSKHLKLLERAGLIHRERDGRVHRCRLDPDRLRAAASWLEHQRRTWEDRFYALDGD